LVEPPGVRALACRHRSIRCAGHRTRRARPRRGWSRSSCPRSPTS